MEYSQKKEDQKIEETFYDKEVEINPRERKIRTYGKLKYGTLCSISWCYCLHKKIDCMDEEGKIHTVKGIYKPTYTRQIFVVQLKKMFYKRVSSLCHQI